MVRYFAHILLLLYVVVFVLLGIAPFDRAVWVAELVPIVAIVLVLVFTYRVFKFSNTAYVLMSVLIFMHTVGAHYTFERVPFDGITNFFGFERNHYDRIAHFSVGFYAYALAELLLKRKLVNTPWILFLFPVFAIFSVAAIYEIIEWWYAATAGAEQGIAFLGSQGDVWDAQKDMLADGLGAIAATVLFFIVYRKSVRAVK